MYHMPALVRHTSPQAPTREGPLPAKGITISLNDGPHCGHIFKHRLDCFKGAAKVEVGGRADGGAHSTSHDDGCQCVLKSSTQVRILNRLNKLRRLTYRLKGWVSFIVYLRQRAKRCTPAEVRRQGSVLISLGARRAIGFP